jgi:hypothetical protein
MMNQDQDPMMMKVKDQRSQLLSLKPETISSPDKLVEDQMDSNTRESHHQDSLDQVMTNLPNL